MYFKVSSCTQYVLNFKSTWLRWHTAFNTRPNSITINLTFWRPYAFFFVLKVHVFIVVSETAKHCMKNISAYLAYSFSLSFSLSLSRKREREKKICGLTNSLPVYEECWEILQRWIQGKPYYAVGAKKHLLNFSN